MGGTRTPIDNTYRPGRRCWVKNIGRQGRISWRGQCAAVGGNGQKGQGDSFGGDLDSFENRYGMVRSNGKSLHGLNFSNHRRLLGKLM